MRKLCTDQLIEELVALLREVDQDKFDEAVAQAKNQLGQAFGNDLDKLFDAQITTLKDRGVPDQIMKILQLQKGAVLEKASKMAIGDGNIPFLPVISLSVRSLYDLMAMVRRDGKAGYAYLNPTVISDVMKAPSELYYIYDVEDGSATLGDPPENAEKILNLQKRYPLTTTEVIALVAHTDVLSRHYVWAYDVWVYDSYYQSITYVPGVSLDYDGRPKLDWRYVDYSDGYWGLASSGSR